MYKVIDGHRYDTEAAREIARAGQETVYRTKTGRYFRAGEGIKPITEDAAQTWIRENCDAQTYERAFDPGEGGAKKMTIVLSAMDAERFAKIKRATGRSYTELLSRWIWEQEL